MMKLGAHGHVLHSSLYSNFWYKAMVSLFRKECTNTASDHKKFGSESDESKTVQKQPVIVINTSSPHYTFAFVNYKQSTAAKQGALKLAV